MILLTLFWQSLWTGGCPLDDTHLWAALRYVELNPVRAGKVESAEGWKWSSAAAHCAAGEPDPMLEMERWKKRWTAAEWRQFLAMDSPAEARAIRESTHTGCALGSADFVARLEKLTLRPLAPQKGGRPRSPPRTPHR